MFYNFVILNKKKMKTKHLNHNKLIAHAEPHYNFDKNQYRVYDAFTMPTYNHHCLKMGSFVGLFATVILT